MSIFNSTKPQNTVILLGLVLILIIGVIGMGGEIINYSREQSSLPEEEQPSIEEPTNDPLPASLSAYAEKKEINQVLIGVMIDNFEPAWPPSGINQALMVYEAPAEAGITRFLALFTADDFPKKVGPVRSIRPYFLEWASEWELLLAHSGGSPEALDNIKKGLYSVYNLEEISSDGVYFYRDSSRQAPHNLYTSSSFMSQATKDKKVPAQGKEILVDPRKIDSEGTIEEIRVGYNEPVVWKYDPQSGSYLRFIQGRSFLDGENKQVRTDNLVVQKTDIRVIDEIGRRFIRTAGEGKVLIFSRGEVMEGTWSKKDTSSPTIFQNNSGRQIAFIPGSVWIEVVSDDHQIDY